jgi:hypothetical protein
MGGPGEASPDGEAGYGMGSITGEVGALPSGGLTGEGGGSPGGVAPVIRTESSGTEGSGFGGGSAHGAGSGQQPEMVTTGFGGGSVR